MPQWSAGLLPAPLNTAPGFKLLEQAVNTRPSYDPLAGERGVVDPTYPSGDVRRYGAKGDGVTDDSAACAAAVAAIPSTGGVLSFQPGTYFLGTLTNTNLAGLLVQGRSNITLVTNGATFLVTDSITVNNQAGVFKFVDCSNITQIGAAFFRGTQLQHQEGPAGILIVADAADSTGYTFDVVTSTQLRSPLEVVSSTANALLHNVVRVRDLRVGTVKGKDCYYGLMCIENGDHVVASLVQTDNAIRSCYLMGIENADVNLESANHNQSSADVLIQTSYTDTRNIRVRYVPRANASADYLVRINHIATTGPNSVLGPASGKVIENVEVFFDDTYAVAGNWGVTIREEQTTGTVNATSAHLVDNVRIGGKFTRYNQVGTIVNCPTAFAKAGRLYVDPSFTSLEALLWTTKLANFLLHLGGTAWGVSLQGDLNTTPLDFNLTRVVTAASGGMHAVVKTKLHLTPDFTGSVGGANQKDQYWEDVHVVFLNAAGTACDIGVSSNMKALAYGGYTPTVAFTGVSGGIRATFGAANGGTAANNRCVGRFEIV